MEGYICDFLGIPYAWMALIFIVSLISYYGNAEILLRLRRESSPISDYIMKEQEQAKRESKQDDSFGSEEDPNPRVLYGTVWAILKNHKIGEFRPIHYLAFFWPITYFIPILVMCYLFFIC